MCGGNLEVTLYVSGIQFYNTTSIHRTVCSPPSKCFLWKSKLYLLDGSNRSSSASFLITCRGEAVLPGPVSPLFSMPLTLLVGVPLSLTAHTLWGHRTHQTHARTQLLVGALPSPPKMPHSHILTQSIDDLLPLGVEGFQGCLPQFGKKSHFTRWLMNMKLS